MHFLNDQNQWTKSLTMESPLSEPELANVQRRVDSLIGTTRDNKSIANVVWNGDVRYWKEVFIDWNIVGEPTKLIKRPWFLFKTIVDDDEKYVRDVFVPRYIILTRLEPEQYVPNWAAHNQFFCPERQVWVASRPTEPPKEHFQFYDVIKDCDGEDFCCKKAKKYGATCFGNFAHPAKFIARAEVIAKNLKKANKTFNPFDSPEDVAARIQGESGINNYEEQAMRRYAKMASTLLDVAPLVTVGDFAYSGVTAREIERQAAENLKRRSDVVEKQIKQNARRLKG